MEFSRCSCVCLMGVLRCDCVRRVRRWIVSAMCAIDLRFLDFWVCDHGSEMCVYVGKASEG